MATSSREAALIRLMRLYEKEVLKVCCIYLQDLSLAEDAAQETFFKAFRAMDKFRGESSEKTWLMRIAINTCKDIRRGAWFRHTDRSVSLDKLPEPAVSPLQAMLAYVNGGGTLEECVHKLDVLLP